MKNYIKNSEAIFLILFCLVASFTSCKKFLEVDPPTTTINKENVWLNDASAVAVLNGIYSKMSEPALLSGESVNSFLSLYPELSSDNLILSGAGGQQTQLYYKNLLTPFAGPFLWPNAYKIIYEANSAIEGLNATDKLRPLIKNQLLGEAKFIRAMHFFYLTNLYGDLPLTLTSDPIVNSKLSRSAQSTIYQSIEKDLLEAQQLLSDRFLNVNLESTDAKRARPSKWAANALLARVKIFKGEYQEAIAEANKIIENSELFGLSTIDEVFIAGSKDAIWQLQPVVQGWNTEDAKFYIIPSTGLNSNQPAYLSPELLSAFEKGDLRRTHWINFFRNTKVIPNETYYYPFKYKVNQINSSVSEYHMILRLSEMYLIRAESRIKLGDISGGITDLNFIRTRARDLPSTDVPNPIPNLSLNLSETDAMEALVKERQTEFFAEMGHRWLDLKRLKGFNNPSIALADEIMPYVNKGGHWDVNWKLYPIPQSERNSDQNLSQNKGY